MFKHENVSELPALRFQNLSDWGPKRDPLYIVVPFTVLFATIFSTGLIGNVSTCIVIARNRSMHTATNYYLFSLAISDLLLLISGLPQEMYYIWSKYPYVFGEAFCVLQGFAAETSANATVLTITAFTVERYIAICHPFLSHTMSKLSRAIKLVIMIWIFAMCLAVPQAMAFGIVYEKFSDENLVNDDHYTCNVKRIVIPHAFLISTILFFVAPMSLITVLYILIGLQLRQSTVGPVRGGSIKLSRLVQKRPSVTSLTNRTTHTTVLMNGHESSHLQLTPQEDEEKKNCFNQSQAASKRVVKMLVAVVVAFFICWAPFHAQRLLAIYGQSDSSDMVTTFSALTYISGVLYYLSTTVNPVLYHIMSHKFRMAFKETFAQCLLKQPGTRVPLRYSSLSCRFSHEKGHAKSSNGRNLLESRAASTPNRNFKRKRRISNNGKDMVFLNSELIDAPLGAKGCDCPLIQCREKQLEENVQNQPVKGVKLNRVHVSYCPPRIQSSLSEDNYRKLEEIEIFHQEQLSIKTLEKLKRLPPDTDGGFRCNRLKKRSSSCRFKINANNVNSISKILTKSITMPNIRVCYFKLYLETVSTSCVDSNCREQKINLRHNDSQLKTFSMFRLGNG